MSSQISKYPKLPNSRVLILQKLGVHILHLMLWGNEISEVSSNFGRSCLHFTSCWCPLKRLKSFSSLHRYGKIIGETGLLALVRLKNWPCVTSCWLWRCWVNRYTLPNWNTNASQSLCFKELFNNNSVREGAQKNTETTFKHSPPVK